jgi:hypothetical protein
MKVDWREVAWAVAGWFIVLGVLLYNLLAKKG